jgi:hypothetical protein
MRGGSPMRMKSEILGGLRVLAVHFYTLTSKTAKAADH